jgi:transcriptional regulator with XRE-family HTH domain
MAGRFGVTLGTWNRWERGHFVPDARMLAKIARGCGVTADWLLFGEEAQARPATGADLLPVDEDERQLLLGYRKLDKQRQQVALESVQGLVAIAARKAREDRKGVADSETTPGKRRRPA